MGSSNLFQRYGYGTGNCQFHAAGNANLCEVNARVNGGFFKGCFCLRRDADKVAALVFTEPKPMITGDICGAADFLWQTHFGKRFGQPDHKKTRHLVAGVVSGIGGYGNCIGVPTVGGEVNFDASYNGNILVNAMCVGLARTDKIFYAAATGVGAPVVYVGSKTGRAPMVNTSRIMPPTPVAAP